MARLDFGTVYSFDDITKKHRIQIFGTGTAIPTKKHKHSSISHTMANGNIDDDTRCNWNSINAGASSEMANSHHNYQSQHYVWNRYKPIVMQSVQPLIPAHSSYQGTSSMCYNIEPIPLMESKAYSVENTFERLNAHPESYEFVESFVQHFPNRPAQIFPDDIDVNLIKGDQVNSSDVLCGRGAGANTHPGNITFRSMVVRNHYAYLVSEAIDKAEISKMIVAEIKKKGGRFLRRSDGKAIDERSSFWFDIGEKAAREKTCQALRERAPGRLNSKDLVFLEEEDIHSPLPLAMKSSGVVVSDNDILLGRGGVTNTHSGNKKYRQLVHEKQREYLAARKLQKATVAMSIVTTIMSNGGRFLQLNDKDEWFEVTAEKAREKTSQALREKAPELRKIGDGIGSCRIIDKKQIDFPKKRKMEAKRTEDHDSFSTMPLNFTTFEAKKQRYDRGEF